MSNASGSSATSTEFQNLHTAISHERLARYLRAARGDLAKAIELYRLNVSLSETLYGVLHGYEITLRNIMHDKLSSYYGQDKWYDRAPLEPWHREMITDAEGRCGRGAYPIGKLISELNLGFWTGLTAGKYQPTMWVPCLSSAFPNTRLGRKQVHAALSDIKGLRNRVAHHERILGSNGQLYAGFHPIHHTELFLRPETVLACIGWICKDTADWVRTTTRFSQSVALLDAPLAKCLII
jgi:hypothetical protein